MRKHVLLLLFLTATLLIQAQGNKKPLGWDDIESWRRITETELSRDGNYVAYKSEPWVGDPSVMVYDKRGTEVASFRCATGIQFTFDSKVMLFTIKPDYSMLRELKINKAKREDMPTDTLAVWTIGAGIEKIPSIRSFRIPSKWSGWMAYQTEPAPASEGARDEKPAKKESATNGYTLYIKNLSSGKVISLPYVTQYEFAAEAPLAYFITTGDDKDFEAGLYIYDFTSGKYMASKSGKGSYRQVVFNKDGSEIAFLFNGDAADKLMNKFSLWHGSISEPAKEIVSRAGLNAGDRWIISDNGRVSFSDSGKRIFFATAPENRQKDTLRLEEDYPDVDIWHWNEGTLHTQQVIGKSRDLRRSYQAVYNKVSGTVFQLAIPDVPDVTLINSGDNDLAVAVTSVPYAVESMWDSTPGRSDVYLIDLNNGKRELIRRGFRGRMQPSQGGKYLMWFTAADSSWYTIRLSDRKEARITRPSVIMAADESNDVPNPPGSYSTAGWIKDDKSVLIYDRYDIWKVDPDAAVAPVRLTLNGRETETVYRVIRFDREQQGISPADKLYLTGHNEITRNEGYYTITAAKPSVPQTLMSGAYSLGTPTKSAEANTVVFTCETFRVFPDLHITDIDFKRPLRISDVNPQQKEFNWGSAEVVSWTSLDGRKVEGLLFKPEGFDPSLKYPMIVNFYELSSQGLHSYRNPEHHRSTIDYHYYTSNGYLVFNPDIHYRDGYPGESAYNCIMPGITALIAEGFVDKARIGAQGHSWGGYQVAYMATRTSLFAAIESGAPVVNMFSAYGGIRWGPD
ncbi:MAG: prolyl oligopeptidase family serine peptidase [Bacteroidales bacterium]|nr:prolyl oligopeptidase family serine peptidase [Bacteroidales bacterium]